MNKFQFNPPNGLLDMNAYPTNPSTEAEARGQVQKPLNQLRDYINLFLDEFVFNKNTNGYTKLPNGLILQWGLFASGIPAISTYYDVFFPISYPNACFNVSLTASGRDSNGNARSISTRVNSLKNNSVQLRLRANESDLSDSSIYWIAIGY